MSFFERCAGVVAIRIPEKGPSEVAIIKSGDPKKKTYRVLPKGHVDPVRHGYELIRDEDYWEAAIREAAEEAGVFGELLTNRFVTLSHPEGDNAGWIKVVRYYKLLVLQVEKVAESEKRDLIWLPKAKAIQALSFLQQQKAVEYLMDGEEGE